MQPLKLLACLVTLQFTCGLTLQATDPQEFRQWTDINGRTIMARLVDIPDADSVQIVREDGRVFTVALTTFSLADQDFVNTWRTEQAQTDTGEPVLGEPDAVTWKLLNSGGSQPASTYRNTRLELILETINQRFAVREIKTSRGRPLALRTEPADLASRVEISGDLPRMSMGTFIKQLARDNNLAVKTDGSGMIVLVDKAPASSPVNFFGVPAQPN